MNKNSRQIEVRENDSYDQPEFSSYHEPEQSRKEYSGEYKFDNFQQSSEQEYGNHTGSLHSYRSNNSEEKNTSYQEKEQSEETNLMQNAPYTYTIPSSETKGSYTKGESENLFTSP